MVVSNYLLYWVITNISAAEGGGAEVNNSHMSEDGAMQEIQMNNLCRVCNRNYVSLVG